MSGLLRDRLDELEVYVSRVAEFTGIPADHVEKDFWVTEVLRGVAATSIDVGCSIVFKGGTSLSKAHRLIQRFSEDVDLIAVLPDGNRRAHDKTLKAFMAGAAAAIGAEPIVDGSSTTRGEKRSAVLPYPTATVSGVLRPGVLVEIGTRGGALPQRRLPVISLIVEHAESVGLPIDFDESAPVSILVLDPVRTLVDKLVLLHHASIAGDEVRKAGTARHYYDIDRLLLDRTVVAQLRSLPVDVLAREVCQHSRAAGMPTADRPAGGFGESPAWDLALNMVARRAYETTVLPNLVWPDAPCSTFQDCCARIQEFRQIL